MEILKISIPEGYEIDQSKSDLSKGIIEFKPIEKKKLNYEDIAKKLFVKNGGFCTSSSGTISEFSKCIELTASEPTMLPLKKQLECLMAYNKLRNVAEYLNEGFNFKILDANQEKWYLYYELSKKQLNCAIVYASISSHVFFKSKELGEKAIEILGEVEIKKALFIYDTN